MSNHLLGQNVNIHSVLMQEEVQSLLSCAVQELMTGDLSNGGSLSSKQLQRMVTALDLASDKNAEISALEAELLQAKSKALLYEVRSRQPWLDSYSGSLAGHWMMQTRNRKKILHPLAS